MSKLDLSPSQRSELERTVRNAPIQMGRRARVILAYADGKSLNAVGALVGLHRDSCRRWLVRYRTFGVAGLQHGNTGKPKNVRFNAVVCAEICRCASTDPTALGEAFSLWSLNRLRSHLIRHGIVRTISTERLRQLLPHGAENRRYWHDVARPLLPLAPNIRHRLMQLAQDRNAHRARRAQVILAVARGASLAEVSTSFHVSKNSIRRWLEFFRLAGVAGLSHGIPLLRNVIVRLTSVPPRAIGASGDAWSLPELRALLLRQGVAPVISLDQLRRVAETAGINLDDRARPRTPQAPSTGFGLSAPHVGGVTAARR